MHTIGFGGERDIDAIVDQQRHAGRLQHVAKTARLLHHGTGGAVFIAQLHQGGATGDQPGDIHQCAVAGDGRIDKRIEPKIDVHQFIRARAMRVGPSRLYNASMMATAKLPGPSAFAAASSPATPIIVSAAAVARQASGSTTRAAATSAEAAQPMAVTLAISAWPLPMVARRSPSLTRSVAPDSPITVFAARA